MDLQLLSLIAAVIALLVGALKTAFPEQLTAGRIPLVVFALATVAAIGGLYTGELSGRPLEVVLNVIVQGATAMGLREAVVGAAGSALVPDALSRRITGSVPPG